MTFSSACHDIYLAAANKTMSGPIISSAWVATEPLQLEIKEKIFSWSGDTFDVKDQHGRAVAKIKGKALSLRDNKQFLDVNGNAVLKMQSKLLTMHATQEFNDMNGKLLFTVKQKNIIQFKNNVEIFLNDGDKDADFSIKGDFFGKEYSIVNAKTNQEIAQIKRSIFNAVNILTGQDMYYLVVHPGTDILFALGIAVAVDEMFHDKDDR
eukprot:jgi/Mesvir1/4645/Mv03461-RA.1